MLINANYVPVIGVPFRCEAFNSLLRTRNVFANRLAPSRDIARGFEVLENLRCLCGGSLNDGNKRYSVEPLLQRGLFCGDFQWFTLDCPVLRGFPSFIPLIIFSVGKDLQLLYESPAVQSYLNGVPAKELYHEKKIYAHATLRKV